MKPDRRRPSGHDAVVSGIVVRTLLKQASEPARKPAEAVIEDIRRATRRQFSSEEKIRIPLRGEAISKEQAQIKRRTLVDRRLRRHARAA